MMHLYNNHSPEATKALYALDVDQMLKLRNTTLVLSMELGFIPRIVIVGVRPKIVG